ncbi:MAG: ImmA/IrrE family metallo-endopeptidase [Gemmatimonadetes bacterium]|nr:ImmA/IrrE family metallo-endopeptidase [Gemmatimonadota bacterium]
MRRGFKSWCETASRDYRSQLGLGLADRLEPRDLAHHLGVLVLTPQELPGLSNRAIVQLTKVDPRSWSAATVAARGRHLVVLNSAHAPTRQRNSLTHELAHVVLNHRPANARVSEEGFLFRDHYDAEQEEEADWLAGALLLPREGLLSAYRRTSSSEVIGRIYGVSTKLVDWRLRMTGILTQARRAGRWRKRAS